MRKWVQISSYFAVVFVLTACAESNVNIENEEDKIQTEVDQSSEEGNENDFSFDRIEYHFQDASVPPEYHRSYSYILTSTTFHYVVDSYGDIIKDTTFALPEGKWEKVQGMFSKAISIKKQKENQPGCTGGHGESITAWKDDKLIFQGSNYYCGGVTEGNLGGDIDGFVETLLNGIDGGILLHR